MAKVWIVQETIGGVPEEPFVFSTEPLRNEYVAALYREGYRHNRYGVEVSEEEAISLGFLTDTPNCEVRVYECEVVEE